MKRSRSTRDRERKDRIKLDLDELRTLLPKCATDKKMVSIDVLWLLYFMNDLWSILSCRKVSAVYLSLIFEDRK